MFNSAFWIELKRGAIVKTLAALFQTALLLAFASVAYSQSLGDIAKQEQDRRKKVTDEKVITDEEAAKYRDSSLTTTVPEQPAAKTDSENKASASSKTEKPESDEPVDFEGRTETYWRQTMAEARQKVKDLEDEATAIELRLNSLQNRFYREDDGFKREGVQQDMQKGYYERDKNKEDLAKAKDMLQDLEKEAKKSGALPGWLGPKDQ
jgi:hypothetical protein